MSINENKLESALNGINAIEVLVNGLFESNRASFEGNKHLSKEFNSFSKLLETTKERLIHPVLSLALVGTTSAGKSTIVNALSGRRVAPMEKLETSAGILRLVNKEKISVEIKKTPRNKWDIGVYSDVTDEFVYEKTKSIYERYKKFEKTCQAPDITVTGPLLIQTNRDLMSLPENISVEFIDLPGIKTIKDVNNLKVIQKALSKSLCVIAIDFNDVDDSRIQRLLDEVRDIVKISGNTDSLLFVLNKVDDIKAEDVPLQERIKTFKNQIKKGLELPDDTEIKIIPFIALVLYWLQTSVRVDNKQQIIAYNQDNFKKLFEDCSNVFNRSLLSKEEYRLKQKIEDKIYDDKEVTIEELNEFYKLCFRLSHADELFEELKHRLEVSFTDIIIRPAVSELFDNLDRLLSDLSTYVKINQKSSTLDLISERIGVQRMRLFLLGASSDENYQSLIQEVKDISIAISSFPNEDIDESFAVVRRMKNDLRDISSAIDRRTEGYIDMQIQGISESVSKIANDLKGIKTAESVNSYLNEIKPTNRAVSVYNGISGIPNQIKKRLELEVLTPFRSSIELRKSRGEFIEEMSKTNPTVYGESIGSNYSELFNLFYSEFTSFTKKDTTYELETKNEKSESWDKKTLGVYHFLDVRMRDILSKKTNIYFQIDTNAFIKVLDGFLKSELDVILKELKKQLPYTESDLSLMIDNLMKVEKREIELPNTLFEFATPKGTKPDKVFGAIGKEIDHYEERSCRADKPVYKTVYGYTYIYKFDNEKGIYQRWDNGIEKSVPVFWTIISYWIIECVNSYMQNIKDSSLQVAEMTLSFLQERINIIQQTNQHSIAMFVEMDKELKKIESARQTFFYGCNTSL